MKKIIFKKVLVSSIISLFFIQMLYIAVEPSIAIADSDTDNVVVTLNVDPGISITDGDAALMAPNIGMTFNKSVGSSSWTVTTNSATGYSLTVKADSTPALRSTTLALLTPYAPIDEFADYTPAGTSDVWGGVASGAKEFGFSAYGTDVLAAYYDGTQPANCGNIGTGVPNILSKYEGFSTGDKQIATRLVATGTSGVLTNICFAAEQNGTYAKSGAYTATITATAATI